MKQVKEHVDRMADELCDAHAAKRNCTFSPVPHRFSLQYVQYSCEKTARTAEKFLPVGHSAGSDTP